MKITALWGFMGDALLLKSNKARVSAGDQFDDVDDEYAHQLIGKGLAEETVAKADAKTKKAEEKAKADADAKAQAEADAQAQADADAKAKAAAAAGPDATKQAAPDENK